MMTNELLQTNYELFKCWFLLTSFGFFWNSQNNLKHLLLQLQAFTPMLLIFVLLYMIVTVNVVMYLILCYISANKLTVFSNKQFWLS